MSRRSKIIIAVLVILALLLLGLWWWLSHMPGTPAPGGTAPAPVNNAVQGLPTNAPPGSAPTNVSYPSANVNAAPAPKQPVSPTSDAAAKKLAMWFAERYGSFSVLGSFENITDLEPVMSEAFAAREQAYVDAQMKQPRPQSQKGTVTVALNATEKAFDDGAGTAQFLVKTQRTEYVGTAPQGSTRYQDILIDLVRESGAWKVDSAVWQQ